MLLKVENVAEWLGLSKNVLQSKLFRNKLGLPGIKIGGALRFDSRDVERLIENGREQFPLRPMAENDDEVQVGM